MACCSGDGGRVQWWCWLISTPRGWWPNQRWRWGCSNTSLWPDKPPLPMVEGARSVSPQTLISTVYQSAVFLPHRDTQTFATQTTDTEHRDQIRRHKEKLTAIRSRVPLTAAHLSCRRSMTRMKPTSVDDKLEHTAGQQFTHWAISLTEVWGSRSWFETTVTDKTDEIRQSD